MTSVVLPERLLVTRLFAGFAALYLTTLSGHYGGDGFSSYLTAESLVLDGDLAILDRPFGIPELSRGTQGTSPEGADGRRYSRYGLGLPLLEAPLYAAGLLLARAAPGIPHDYFTMAAVSTLNAFVTAAVAALLFAAARGRGMRGRVSLAAPLAFGIGSFAWGNSRLGFAEPSFTLCLFSAYLLIEEHRATRRLRSLLLAGALAGFAIHLKIYGVILLPILALATMKRGQDVAQRARALVLFAAPVLLSVALLAVANALRFGGPLRTGYELATGLGTGARFHVGPEMIGRILGLAISPAKGILWYAPPLLLTVALLPALRRANPRAFAWIAGITLLHLFFYGTYSVWHGDFAWGPRFLYPALPFLILPLCDSGILTLARRGSLFSGRPRAVILLIAAGALIELPVLFVNFSRHLEEFAPGHFSYWRIADSPILGNWRQLGAALARRGEWDVWFFTLPALRPSPLVTIGATLGAIALTLSALLAFGSLWRALAREEAHSPDAGAPPASLA